MFRYCKSCSMNKPSKKRLSSSLEDYLEAIYHLEQDNRVARTKDIAQFLDVNMSSVTGALKGLAKKGMVEHSPYSYVTLTDVGKKIAADVVRRHEALTDFLVKVLGIASRQADENACRMEHAVDSKITHRLVRFLQFLEDCPLGDEGLIKGFRYYCEHGRLREDCQGHIEKCSSND